MIKLLKELNSNQPDEVVQLTEHWAGNLKGPIDPIPTVTKHISAACRCEYTFIFNDYFNICNRILPV